MTRILHQLVEEHPVVLPPLRANYLSDLKLQGHGVGKEAVHAMLGYLFDAFLPGSVGLATQSERQRNSNPRKLYLADPGLIATFDTSPWSNLGHALETAMQNELARTPGGCWSSTATRRWR